MSYEKELEQWINKLTRAIDKRADKEFTFLTDSTILHGFIVLADNSKVLEGYNMFLDGIEKAFEAQRKSKGIIESLDSLQEVIYWYDRGYSLFMSLANTKLALDKGSYEERVVTLIDRFDSVYARLQEKRAALYNFSQSNWK